DLMEKNKQKMATLQQSLAKQKKVSGAKIAELEKMIATLNDQMMQKNKELEGLNQQIAALNTKVEKLNTDVSDLTAQNTTKQKTIDDQTVAMHMAYYTVGTSKVLMTQKVI